MAFVSFWFYIFLAAVVGIYYILPIKFRWLALLAASLGFYWCICDNSIIAFSILVGMSFVSWILSLLMSKKEKSKKAVFFILILLIVFPLLAFKEFQYIFNTFFHKSMPLWWIAPIGFSFYTMQLIAYVSDAYQKKADPEKNYLKFLLFVSFFPQIIQGPIPRYNQLGKQLVEGHRLDEKKFVKGFMMILWGFFLKLCIADKAGIAVDTIFNNFPTYQGLYVLVGRVLYSFQLYADFLACTSFAQGFSGLVGIDIIDNFARPYFAVSVKDFWRRWHISLSSWLKDYIYIPLGGNRKGTFIKYINILITFAVSGIWHGGGIKFIFWGALHGLYQIFGDILTPVKSKLKSVLKIKDDSKPLRIFQSLWTFALVMIAWIIFRADNLKIGLSMIKSMFTVHNIWIFTDDSLFRLGLEWKEVMILLLCLAVLFAVGLMKEKGIAIRDNILELNIALRWGIYIAVILFIVIFGTYGFGFDAQAFIYGRF